MQISQIFCITLLISSYVNFTVSSEYESIIKNYNEAYQKEFWRDLEHLNRLSELIESGLEVSLEEKKKNGANNNKAVQNVETYIIAFEKACKRLSPRMLNQIYATTEKEKKYSFLKICIENYTAFKEISN